MGDLPSVLVNLYDMCEERKISHTEKRYEMMRFYFLLKDLLEEHGLHNKVEFIYMKGNYGIGGLGLELFEYLSTLLCVLDPKLRCIHLILFCSG